MKNFITSFLILQMFFLISCNSISLKEPEAEKLIMQTLSLPQTYNVPITYNTLLLSYADGCYYTVLLENGFIYKQNDYNIEVNEDKSKPYLIGKGSGKTFYFKKYDIGFDKIILISIDKENKTARIRFSLKYTNIPPYTEDAEMKSKRVDLRKIGEGELEFKKYDNGWLLTENDNQKNLTNDRGVKAFILERVMRQW